MIFKNVQLCRNLSRWIQTDTLLLQNRSRKTKNNVLNYFIFLKFCFVLFLLVFVIFFNQTTLNNVHIFMVYLFLKQTNIQILQLHWSLGRWKGKKKKNDPVLCKKQNACMMLSKGYSFCGVFSALWRDDGRDPWGGRVYEQRTAPLIAIIFSPPFKLKTSVCMKRV